jgi:hypoxanthine phosphoribosyltransferase
MPTKMSNKLFYSWEEIDKMIDIISLKIINNYPEINSVLGIKRGGLIPAVMISHKLGIPLVDQTFHDTLVIDDICDSGNTLLKGPGVYTAVLLHKPHTSVFTPNIWAEEYKGNGWIVFPWEKSDSLEIQDYLKLKK